MASAISVSESTFDRLRKIDGFPTISLPGSSKPLFDPEDVVAWLKEQDDPDDDMTLETASESADAVFGA